MSRRSEHGAALLIALGGLALIAALSVAALSASTGPATRANTAIAQAEATRAAEASIHRLIAAGADANLRRALPADGRVISTKFYGADLDISGQDASGLIDLNAAPEAVLARLLLLTEAEDGEDIAAIWVEARRGDGKRAGFAHIGDAFKALPSALRAQALPARDHLTIWSSGATVDPFLATAPALAAAADISLAAAQGFVAERTLEGRSAQLPEGADPAALSVSDGTTVTLKVRATTPTGGRAALAVTVRFTTSPRAPVTILSWQ